VLGNAIIKQLEAGSISIDSQFMQETFSEEFLAATSPDQKLQWLDGLFADAPLLFAPGTVRNCRARCA